MKKLWKINRQNNTRYPERRDASLMRPEVKDL